MTEQGLNVVQEIVSELERLPDEKIVEVLDFVRFLGWQEEAARTRRYSHRLDEAQLTRLYAESADEDQALAETGITDYAASLKI